MNSIRKVALACMTAAMVTMSVNAGAQSPRNQDTFFTFSQQVELPKTTLPAGTYLFQLMDSSSNRHIVKVMSQDRKELHATLMAIPYYSNERPSDEPQVRFMETPAQAGANTTNAIKIWFYPGNSVGHEFIYPRSQALQIASRTGQSVLTTKSETEVSESADLSRVNANGVDAEANLTAQASPESAQAEPAPQQRETVGAITGAPERATSEPAPTPETAPAPAPERRDDAPARDDAAARTDLPNTAGALPLLALIGIGSIVGSRLVRRYRA
jgi:hypothetical protein